MHKTLMVTKMKVFNLDSMKRGWFVGNFEPSVYKTEEFEVAVKRYKKGEHEKSHYHKIATEITAIISGKVRMNGKNYKNGEIIVINPGEYTDFEFLEDGTITVVVKIPGANDDKYTNNNFKI